MISNQTRAQTWRLDVTIDGLMTTHVVYTARPITETQACCYLFQRNIRTLNDKQLASLKLRTEPLTTK
jgi:hypothetical protein